MRPSTHEAPCVVDEGAVSRFVVRGLLMMGGLYLALYFPYPHGSAPAKLLQGYLHALAFLTAKVLAFFGDVVVAQGDQVLGRFPLRIVLDCGALDVLAMFSSAVLAFPATLRNKIWGLLAGSTALFLINLMRIVALYHVGVHVPEAFALVHEEVMQLLLLIAPLVVFARYLRFIQAQAFDAGVEARVVT